MTRKTIIARQGFILTNGETYAKIVDLAENENANRWYEITEEEYQEILKEQEDAAQDI